MKTLTTLLLSFLFTIVAQAQISVFEANQELDPETGEVLTIEESIVLNLMGASYDQLDISNISLSCPPGAVGYFLSLGNSSEVFELTSGLAMSTGCLEDLPGPNEGIISSSACGGGDGSGDEDLEEISGVPTNDACILEFDIKAFGNAFVFDYVFGSEEYDSYVCTPFNDVFAFLITGPNPNGEDYVNQNIALIPNTNLPVAINTVNDGIPDGGANDDCLLEYSNFYAGESPALDFEGLTQTFTAYAEVIACETYHLKLAIADGSDSALDSGVFIEGGSLEAEPQLTITENGGIEALSLNDEGTIESIFETDDGTEAKILIENCNTREISFDLGEIEETCTLFLEISGTAENGTDFTNAEGGIVPDVITFTPEQSNRTLEFVAQGDDTEEGIETIIVKVIGIDGMICGSENLVIKTQTIRLIDNAAEYTEVFAIENNYGPFDENISIPVSAIGGDSYNWFPAEYFENPNQRATNMTLLEDVTYGCEISNNACTETVYMRDFEFNQDIVEPIDTLDTGLTSLEDLGINIFPNPVVDYLNLSGIRSDFTAVIYDQNGQQILETTETKIDFSFFDAGLYFIAIELEGRRYFEKVLK